MDEAMRKDVSVFLFIVYLSPLFFGGDVLAQYRTGPFAPPVGQSGTKAMNKDSSAFAAWASDCNVRRGPQDSSDLSKGYASAGSPSNASGPADGSSVVSLGDRGSATLEFDVVLQNGPGFDFAVFENSFDDSFLELAFVEVSSNGSDFVRFPAVSLTDTSSQVGSFGSLDATNLYNLAGKYRGGYGTPFDLQELSDSSAVNIDSITHVRIVDAIGCIQDDHATYDSNGRAVNDPWPTAFSSSGFDLDAVGVINTRTNTSVASKREKAPRIHYDQAQRAVQVKGLHGERTVELYDSSGKLCSAWSDQQQERFSLPSAIDQGVHILRVKTEGKLHVRKLLIR